MNPNTILPMVTKFQESRILLTVAEMNVFTLLENNPPAAGPILMKKSSHPLNRSVISTST